MRGARALVRAVPAALLAGLALGGAAHAGSPAEDVRRHTERLVKILEDPTLGPAERRAAVRRVAAEAFDVAETARRALGRHWHARTPAERGEFVRLFTELLERAYVHRIDLYAGERVHITGETVDGDYAVVRGRLVSPQRGEVPVEARLHRREGRWRIYDIAVEHVSLVANYRAQFDRIIRTASYEELVRRLRARRDQEPEATAPGRGGS